MADSSAVLPWGMATIGVITLDKIVASEPLSPKDYVGAAFAYLVLLLLPDTIAKPFAILILIGVLLSRHGFLTVFAKK